MYLFVGMCSVEGTPHCHVQMRTSEVPTCNLRTLCRQVYNGQLTPNQPSFNCKSLAMHGGVPTISRWPFQRLNIIFTYFLETLPLFGSNKSSTQHFGKILAIGRVEVNPPVCLVVMECKLVESSLLGKKERKLLPPKVTARNK